ncbi:hypothetical protein N7465_011372 [Penicillium sp. CMV-2018d]|nr:hypothetical protein N7465_011372 [Penicillium sp. CMV-2018d]
MTDQFCDVDSGCQSNCGHPDPPTGKADKSVLKNKVIGYYESWYALKDCHQFPPSAIPVEGLTHINFAFAYIDPISYVVVPMGSDTPAELFAQTADVRTLKSGNGDIEVFVSIGGWTFSDNKTKTQPVFGDIASCEYFQATYLSSTNFGKAPQKRQTFASNLVEFMQNYGFDGVDIDWEYPGASDRGGKEEDVENYVKLFETLRHTFDASEKGNYGLSFTIPSSYWYLRWFDLKGMMKYADWVNLMSYDLHGVWDRNDPIGSIVLAHTNLTEIKEAAELLWRSNVPPEKVVLGLGFYGRSFQLKDKKCSDAGCAFAGAANKGSCTGNAGTLAYFEIQNIIKDQKPKIIHDKKAAVNYIVFDDDQWVSFDNNETFKQKVDWADSVGLGGVMIWSIDQDDNDFSALTGLLGRSPGDFDSITEKSKVTDTGHWASMNGQKCVETDCAMVPTCAAGYQLAPFANPKSFRDDCSGSKSRVICCPVDAMPESCTWRGGETSRSCHGQCHAGEVTLFHSRHATTNCYKPGFQAACCSADTYSNLIDACYIGKTSDVTNGWGVNKQSCPSGYNKISEVFGLGPGDISWLPKGGRYFPICCPSSSAFQNCHWVGKGTCDDNECSDTDVEFMTDVFGMSNSQCANGLNNRKKVLCCNPPKNVSPFLPVALDKVFPTLPPKSDYPEFDLQLLGGDHKPTVNEPNQQTFGMVIIDGPPGTVDNLKRRGTSDLTVLDCENISEYGSSTVRLVCPESTSGDHCNIGEGAVKGTILHMPDGCGVGTYAVAHNIQRSENQELPSHIKRSFSGPSLVYDLELSYDFKRVKRNSGDIYIRIDYSNEFNYWESIVQGDPAKAKRDGHKRFYSSSAEAWKTKFDAIRGVPGLSSLHDDHFRNTIVSSKADTCKDSSWVNVEVGGDVSEEMKFGYSFVGTISPTFNIEEAYGFFDSKLLFHGSIDVDIRGAIDVDSTLQSKQLFTGDITGYGFSHPGICDMGPSLNAKARLIGKGHSLDAKFTADVIAGNGQYTKSNLPLTLGGSDGDVTNDVSRNPFSGGLSVNPSVTKSNKKRDIGTVLALQLTFESKMQISVNSFESTLLNLDSQSLHQIDSFMRIKDDGSVTWTNNRVTVGVVQTGDLPGWDGITGHQVGSNGQVNVLRQSGRDAPDVNRDTPDIRDDALFDSGSFVACLGNTSSTSLVCLTPQELIKVDPTLAIDPETGNPYSDQYGTEYAKRDIADIFERFLGGRRPYSVQDANGGSFPLRQSLAYYYGHNGADLLAQNANAGHHAASDAYNCEDLTTTDNSDDPTLVYVSEHGLELQYLPRLLEFFQRGMNRDPDGTIYTSDMRVVPRNLLDDNSYFQTDYSVWDPTGSRTGIPNDRIWEAFGSRNNPQRNVNTEQTLNGYKARIFAGTSPMSDTTWNEHGYNEWNQPDSVERVNEALSVVNQVMHVFNYWNNYINHIVADSLNVIEDELTYFAGRVNAVDPQRNLEDLGPRHMEFAIYVVNARLERVESWVRRRLEGLRGVWMQAEQARHPNAAGILETINKIVEDIDNDPSALMGQTYSWNVPPP